MEETGRKRDEPVVVHLAQCKLVVVKGAQRGKEYVFSGDVIRVGKAEDNDLVLAEETVSRVHLEILRDAKGYLLRDLHSTNGTFLDGAEIREAYIRAGSVITVGTVQLKFQPFEERIEVSPSPRETCGELTGRARAMREIFGLIERIAPTEATMLIEGEEGTGRGLIARAVHAHSRRKGGPFLAVDCAAMTAESELFGHEKGALPGASTTRQGAFELAHGGTLFLEEIGELSLEAQPKLLRVLEQRELRRAGGNRSIKVDVRVLASTRRDLRREVEKGKFREDLYFRLSVVPMKVPPLRERREDVGLLAARFRERVVASGGAIDPALDGAAGDAALAGHDWPGNVKELAKVIERGVPVGRGAAEAAGGAKVEEGEFESARSYRDNKDRWEREFERRYLKWLLDRAEGNISRAAREADMDRKYLHKLLKKHNIVT